MRNSILWLLSLTVMGPACLGEEALYKGSFDGWTFGYEDETYEAGEVWRMQENGELHVRGRGHSQSGMRTNRKYGNYELSLEYRWLTRGFLANSGIWIHGQDDWAIDNGAFPTSIEVQLWKCRAGDLLRKGLEIEPEPGYPSEGEAVYRRPGNGIVEHYDGNWNLLRIRAEGSTISVWLNGEFINRAINCNKNGEPVTKGYITLQAEGSDLAFRNIVIRNLDEEMMTPEGPEHGTMIDSRDGQSYRTVRIGNQVWMAENLNFAADGSKLLEVPGGDYGRLYNWESALIAAPEGWHVPSHDEWIELLDFLGGWESAGRKLKSRYGWALDMGRNHGENTSGFNALPGGWSSQHGGPLLDHGKYGHWWTSSPCGELGAWGRSLLYNSGAVYLSYQDRDDFFSVRCVRN